MKVEQQKTQQSADIETLDAPLSRRAMLGISSIAVLTAAVNTMEIMRDRSASVDEIVNNPDGQIRYREVVCTGLAKGAGHAEVTTIVGGFPMSSSAAAAGIASQTAEVVKKLPIYSLSGSSSETSLSFFRDCDGIQEGLSDWKTTELEKKLQNGGEALVKVSGHLAVRDGKQYLIFSSIKEVTPGKQD
jgi:hypothetical protein